MADTALVFDSIAHSNLPAHEKSAIRRWAERALGGHTGLAKAKSHVHATAHAVRAGGESLVTGALLGALHAELPSGLDTVIKGKAVPIDGVGGVLALAASCYMGSHDELSTDARNIGATGVGIFGFRKSYDFLAEKKLAKGEKPGGVFGPQQTAKVAGEITDGLDATDMGEDPEDDPVVAVAKQLDQG